MISPSSRSCCCKQVSGERQLLIETRNDMRGKRERERKPTWSKKPGRVESPGMVDMVPIRGKMNPAPAESFASRIGSVKPERKEMRAREREPSFAELIPIARQDEREQDDLPVGRPLSEGSCESER